MSSAAEPVTAYAEFLEQLLSAGLLIETGVPGVYGKSGTFERVLGAFDAYVTESGADQDPEVMRFPPVVTRRDFERSGYLKSFPHLTGVVSGFHGKERDHAAMISKLESGADWTGHFDATDLVLTPAACYPVYPYASGTLPAGGRLFDVQSYCFRREPSEDPARMQSFRMHEYIRIGAPAQVREFRDLWLERGSAMLSAVGLEPEAVVANDPFFGRGGNMLAASQRDQALKFELVVRSAPTLRVPRSCRATIIRTISVAPSRSRRRMAPRPTRRASVSVSSGSRWRSSAPTVTTFTDGPHRYAAYSGCDDGRARDGASGTCATPASLQ